MNKYETIQALAEAGKHAHTHSAIEGAVRKVLDGDRLGVEDAIRLRHEYKDDWTIWGYLESVFYDAIDNVELGIAPIYKPSMTVPVLDDPVYPGSERELGIFESAAMALIKAFSWVDDTKGHDYWSTIHKKLESRVDNGNGPRLEPLDFDEYIPSMALVDHVRKVVFDKIRWEDDIDGEAYWMDAYKNLCRVYTSFDGDHFDPKAETNKTNPSGERAPAARDLDMLARARDIVMGKINWSTADEGQSYWADVYDKLCNLGAGGDPTAYVDRNDASTLIDSGMTWSETDEGFVYWSDVQDKLGDRGL